MNINKRVVLYYPSHVTGGAEFLLKTVADILKDLVPVVVVDVKNGWLSNNIADVEVIYISDNPIYLDNNTVLITTANLVRDIDLVFCGHFKLLSWIVQVFNVIPSLPRIGGLQHKGIMREILKRTILKSEYSYFKNQIDYLKLKRSIVVMDDGCAEIVQSRLDIELNRYLPVAIPDKKIVTLKKDFSNFGKKVRIIWLGRLDGQFKNPILKRVIEDAYGFFKETGFEITIDIVGNGPGFSDIYSYSKSFSALKFVFHNEKSGHELQRVLKMADIGFAMGTSALEIAACYTPTVLLDASYNKVSKNYRYKWLYEEKGYSLGRSIDSSSDVSMGNKHTFRDIILELIDNPDFQSEHCYSHVLNNHSVDSLKDKLIIAIRETEFSFEEAREMGLFKKPFWYPLKKIFKK